MVMERTRISTGIYGLDEKMQGGLFKGSVNLITGKTGTGKSAFCSSFLRHGALIGESGLYVTTEQREEDIKGDLYAMFGWDMKPLEEKNTIKFMTIQPIFPSKEIQDMNKLVRIYIADITERITRAIKEVEAKRVVIDSVSIIEMFIKDKYISRVAIMQLVERLKKLEVTAVLTGTIQETSEALSGGGIVEYLVDSVIKLDFVPVAEEYKRTLTIRKMRRTDHSTLIHPFEITKAGIRVIEIK